MEGRPQASEKAADAYRKGCYGKQVEQGESLATYVNPLSGCQAPGGQESDLEQGKEYPWR
ncbi:MAG: hypothetical protein Kow0089_18760 [Desulfobulbaceae bacterium]